jgi:hypothetical protein
MNSNFYMLGERERDLFEGSGGAVTRVWDEELGDFGYIEELSEIT